EVVHNRDEFPMSFTRGSWEGFWWAFISMTTVGYGDKCPRSIAGRCFAVVWIFAGVILVSVFAANVTTALTATTAGQKDYRIDELVVGVLKDSFEESYAKEKGAETKAFKSFEHLLTAIKEKQVSGILVDRYVMGYHLEHLQTSDSLVNTLTRVKHYSGQAYAVGAVVASQYAKKMMDECFGFPTQYEYPTTSDDVLLETLNESMTDYGEKIVNNVRMA
ncbi:hypothetical protein QZH41_014199, partial [Actinostola sp. cb2023]